VYADRGEVSRSNSTTFIMIIIIIIIPFHSNIDYGRDESITNIIMRIKMIIFQFSNLKV